MRQLIHPLVLAVIGAVCLGVTAAAAQSGTAAQPGDVVLSAGRVVSEKSSPPPLALSEDQRTKIKQVLSTKDSEVDFSLKTSKSAHSFEAKVGARFRPGLESMRRCRPRNYEMPALKRYST